jgi:hypothetical protein
VAAVVEGHLTHSVRQLHGHLTVIDRRLHHLSRQQEQVLTLFETSVSTIEQARRPPRCSIPLRRPCRWRPMSRCMRSPGLQQSHRPSRRRLSWSRRQGGGGDERHGEPRMVGTTRVDTPPVPSCSRVVW